MSNRQKNANADDDTIKFYESELVKTHKEIVLPDDEFAAMSPEEQAEHPIGYAGYRFKTVPITDDDRNHWRQMIAALRHG